MDKIFEGVSFRDVGTALLDLAMPRRCVVCRQPLLLHERYICIGCLCDLPLTHYWERPHNPMADKFNERIQESLQEGSYEPYAFAAALFFYNSESLYKRIPQHLKYEGGIESGRYFSKLLGEELAAAPQFADIDCIVPVPLHWARRWKRGYNQAEIIAEAIAMAFGGKAEMCADTLRRRRRTRTQIRVSVGKKAANVRGAFAFKGFPGAFHPRHVLLVDDTFTTGSTLNACREALRERLGPDVRISVAALAFVKS
ncbi:MAG: hypothetical protein Q4G10_00635 [Bacteroidia bacterium]|nr:hypothetical protein [Bacteroidia bacterium]